MNFYKSAYTGVACCEDTTGCLLALIRSISCSGLLVQPAAAWLMSALQSPNSHNFLTLAALATVPDIDNSRRASMLVQRGACILASDLCQMSARVTHIYTGANTCSKLLWVYLSVPLEWLQESAYVLATLGWSQAMP
jgi:hypothetical protein